VNEEALVYWITERENIRKAKEQGKSKPWSDNEVMQQTYFCNVHREDDKVTRWVRTQWALQGLHNIEANMCMARLVNRIESLKALNWPWDHFDAERFGVVANNTQPFWGSAYVVTTHGQPMSKVDYAIEVLGAIFRVSPTIPIGSTLNSAHGVLTGLEGFGSFMAAQVVADLKNTVGHTLQNAVDRNTWSAHGPGSLRGLGWILDCKVTPGAYHNAIYKAWTRVRGHLAPKEQVMCMQDFQNCLCEFDKFMRVTHKTGKSKRRYNGA